MKSYKNIRKNEMSEKDFFSEASKEMNWVETQEGSDATGSAKEFTSPRESLLRGSI